jgi:hypothetical protein
VQTVFSFIAGGGIGSLATGIAKAFSNFFSFDEGGMSMTKTLASVDPNEVHLPLNSPQTIKALSSAMKQAGGAGGGSDSISVGDINVTIKTDNLDSSNTKSVAQQVADELKRKTPEAIRLAKLAFKTGQAYAGESV